MNRAPQFGDIYGFRNSDNYIILGIILRIFPQRREWLYDSGNDVDDNTPIQGFTGCPEEIGYTFICNQDDIELPTKKTCCKKEERYKSGELPAVGDIISACGTWVVIGVNPFMKVLLESNDYTPAGNVGPNAYDYVQRYDESVPHYPQIGDIYQNSFVENSNTYRLVVDINKTRTRTILITYNHICYLAPWDWNTSDLVAEKNNRFICNQEELEPVFDESLIIPGAIVEYYMGGRGELNKEPFSTKLITEIYTRDDERVAKMTSLERSNGSQLTHPLEFFQWGKMKYIQHTNDNLCPNDWCLNCHGKTF